MEYYEALEEKTNEQDKRITEHKASIDSQTVLTKATDFATSAVEPEGANGELKDIRYMMKQPTASITKQDATLEYLYTNMNRGGGGGSGGQNTDKKQ